MPSAARVLGPLSVAMGLSLLAPAHAARLFGLGERTGLMRAIAARDLVVGIGLLRSRRPAPWLRAHAVCDAVDGAGVAIALLRGAIPRWRGLAWLALAATGGAVALIGSTRRSGSA